MTRTVHHNLKNPVCVAALIFCLPLLLSLAAQVWTHARGPFSYFRGSTGIGQPEEAAVTIKFFLEAGRTETEVRGYMHGLGLICDRTWSPALIEKVQARYGRTVTRGLICRYWRWTFPFFPEQWIVSVPFDDEGKSFSPEIFWLT